MSRVTAQVPEPGARLALNQRNQLGFLKSSLVGVEGAGTRRNLLQASWCRMGEGRGRGECGVQKRGD